MIRVDGFYLYSVGYSIHPLTMVNPGETFQDSLTTLFVGLGVLEQLFSQSVYTLKVSRAAANELYAVLKPLTEDTSRTAALTHYEAYQINSLAAKFEHVLAAEFGLMDIYLVSKKRGYDTSDLITNGVVLFPEELQTKVPEAKPDIDQGTRCIAFELATAAGFHLHRANESVLHRYYDAATGGKPRPSGRNIGDYLTALNKHNVGDAKIKSALRDLKDLHRNPLIHPEDSLDSVDEAIALLGSIQGVIIPMLKEIPLPAPAPTTIPGIGGSS
jgi:hypothetical protein